MFASTFFGKFKSWFPCLLCRKISLVLHLNQVQRQNCKYSQNNHRLLLSMLSPISYLGMYNYLWLEITADSKAELN